MAFQYLHPEEKFQVWTLIHYADAHPDNILDIHYEEGERYRCLLDTAYESENGGELDIEPEDPLYDEFLQVAMEIIEIIHDGPRRYNASLTLDYRDFPTLIIDSVTGETVYSASSDPLRW